MLDLQETFYQAITRSIAKIRRSKAQIIRSQEMESKHGENHLEKKKIQKKYREVLSTLN